MSGTKTTVSENKSVTGNKIITGVIWKQLMLFFFPLLFGTFFQMLYNTTDSVIVGRFVGVNALSAIGGASAMIVNVVIGAFTGLTSGATVIIAQYYGAGEKESVSKAVHTAVAMAIVIGAVLTAAGILFARRMLVGMNTPAETLDDSEIYLVIYFIGLIPNLLYNTGASILRAIGDSKRPLWFLIIGTMSNIVLDLLFVAGLKMGVAGAAAATILCQALSAVMVVLALMRSSDGGCRLVWRKVRISGDYLKRILQIGVPAMIQSLTYSISNVILQIVVNGFGTSYVAAWASCSKGDQIFWMISQSFGISVTTFVGQNYGAGLKARVRRCIRQSVLIDVLLTLTSQVFLWYGASTILGLFTTDRTVLGLAYHMMHFFIPCYLTFTCVEVFSGALRGMGDSLIPMLISVFGVCGLRILWVAAALPHWPQFDTVMYSYPITWVITSVLLVVYYFLQWRRKGRI